MNEAELLFTELLNCDRMALYQNKSVYLDSDKSSWIASVLKRRIAGEPIQYILGKAEFMGLEFKVNQDVLIPRPETEILAEAAIKIGSRLLVIGSRLKVLDIGTGSGCIAIALAKSLPQAKIDAIDISDKALTVAKENAKSNKVNIHFMQGNLFDAYSLQLTAYSLIVSNPPYVSAHEIETLQPEISHEPRIALDGGENGLDFYRKIILQAPAYLEKDGLLILEIGFDQIGHIKNLFQEAGGLRIVEVIKDYNNIDRVVVAKKSQFPNPKSQITNKLQCSKSQ